MANENIKIIVQEVDETRPRGSGVSSDIVYVPGLAHDLIADEYRNKPVLCTSVDEFESYFGSEPYRFNVADAEYPVNGVAVRAGEYDKSYIYAKELLNAGLSVLYEDISPDKTALENQATFYTSDTNLSKLSGTRNVFRFNTIDSKGVAQPVKTKVSFQFSDMLNYGDMTLLLRSVSDPLWLDANGQQLTCKADITAVTAASGSDITCEWPQQNSNVMLLDEGNETEDPTTGNAGGTETPSVPKDDTDSIDSTVCTLHWNDTNVNGKVVNIEVTVFGKGDFSLALVHGTDIATSVSTEDDTRFAFFYNNVGDRFNVLEDKNEYTVKYLTLGGYPSFVKIETGVGDSKTEDYSIAAKMLDCAAKRNDAVALIDHKDDPSTKLWGDGSIYKDVNDYFQNAANTEFGAMFTPWGNYTCTTVADATLQAMPASFGYLLCLAKAIKTSPNWLAMAGVTRGIVPGLQKLRTKDVLSNVIAENYQPKYGDIEEKNVISINAITNVKPYGLTIWGNRTLKRVAQNGTVATNFLNIRNMMSDIKKLAYNTAKSLMFEQESDQLWLKFKSGVSPLLDQLKSGYGIADYKLIKNTTKYNGKALTRGEMSAVIKIFPLYAVEYFEITVVVSDNDVAVS
jgi:hypothetical protein